MSDQLTPKWEADGFRVLYDPTPGGVPQEGGGRSYSLRIPALEVTEWVQDREKVAASIATALNEEAAKDAEIARLREALTQAETVLRHNPDASQPPRYRAQQASRLIHAALKEQAHA